MKLSENNERGRALTKLIEEKGTFLKILNFLSAYDTLVHIIFVVLSQTSPCLKLYATPQAS